MIWKILHWLFIGIGILVAIGSVIAAGYCRMSGIYARADRELCTLAPGLEYTADPDVCRDKALSMMGDAYRKREG